MPAKPGTRPPNAGKRGRKPGTPNKVTRTTREMFSAFVDNNAEKAQVLFDRVARKNPARALQILSSFAEFVVPRLQRTELDATVKNARVYPAWEDMGPEEAAQAYQEMLRDVDGKMQFAPPRPKPPATAPTLAAPRPAAPAVVVPILRAEPTESVQAPTSPQPHPVEQEYIPADPAPPSMSQQNRDLWERLGRPANPEEALSALDAALRQQHVHRPMADSICAGCRAMWVRG